MTRKKAETFVGKVKKRKFAVVNDNNNTIFYG